MPTSMATLCVKRLAMLLTAQAVLQDENRWIQGNFGGRNRTGPRDYAMTNVFNPEAECFCAMGGMAYATTLLAGRSRYAALFVPEFLNQVYGQGLEIFMQGAVHAVTTRPVSLAGFNDNTSHEEVMKVFAQAIGEATKNIVMRHSKLELDNLIALAKQDLEEAMTTWDSRVLEGSTDVYWGRVKDFLFNAIDQYEAAKAEELGG